MAILHILKADYLATADLLKEFVTANGATITASNPRTGIAAYRVTVGNSGPCKALDSALQTLAVAFAVRPDNLGAGSEILALSDNSEQHLSVKIEVDGSLTVRRRNDGGTVLITSAAGLAIAGTYLHVELYAKISDTVGEASLWVNEVLQGSYSGDTQWDGTSTVTRVYVKGAGVDATIDDWIISDGSRIRDQRIFVTRPNGEGTYTDFTPSAGDNWENVDDATPDGASTYNAGASDNQKDSYTITAIAPAAAATITGVQIIHSAKGDNGSRNCRAFLRGGSGAITNGPTVAVNSSYAYVPKVVTEVNPDTSAAFTLAQVNAIEAGIEVLP